MILEEKYKKLIANSIIDAENEFADIACIDVTSIGNAFSTGNGIGYIQQEKEEYYSKCNDLYVSKDEKLIKLH